MQKLFYTFLTLSTFFGISSAQATINCYNIGNTRYCQGTDDQGNYVDTQSYSIGDTEYVH